MFTIRVRKTPGPYAVTQPTMYLESSYYVKLLPSLSHPFAIKLGYRQS